MLTDNDKFLYTQIMMTNAGNWIPSDGIMMIITIEGSDSKETHG